MERLGQIVPAFRWLPDYNIEKFRGDLAAGLTVGIMLIPQGMAYALLAGVPAIYGLYASLIPLVVYPLLGTSRHLAVGPVAISLLILAAGVGQIAEPYSDHYIVLAALVALMVGVIQIGMGVFRLGFVVNFLSRPVIAGFMTAAPLIIAASQLGSFLGIDLPNTSNLYVLGVQAFEHLSDVHLLALGIGVVSMVILFGLQSWKPRAPAALIVVVLGIAAVYFLDLQSIGLEVVGDIPRGLPHPVIPPIDGHTMGELLPTAITIALEQCMVVMSLGKVFGAKHGYSVQANRELMAIGASNALGSIFQGLPVSGSFSRSAVNEQAGAKTGMTNVIAATVIGLTLLFLTPVFYYLPVPVLAAVIMVAAIGLIDLPELRYLLKTKKRDGFIALLTFGCVVTIGIQEGILIGIGASILAILYRISLPNVPELGHMPGTKDFRSIDRNPEAEPIKGIHILRVDASLSFANAELIKQKLLEESQVNDDGFDALVIDATGVNDLDTTSAAMLSDVIDTLTERGVEFYISGAKGQVRDTLKRSGLHNELGEERFTPNPDIAVQDILSRWGKEHRYEAHEAHDAEAGGEQPASKGDEMTTKTRKATLRSSAKAPEEH